jgi:CcmD family protein
VSNEWDFVIAAYAVTWLVLIGYATYVAQRLRRAARAIEGGDA